jgi:thioredoxin reductase
VVALAPGFDVTLDDGRVIGARRVLLATGLRDELPDIPGLAERWGRTVLHCPYCHGWEVRDRAIGVIGINAMAVHGAQLWRQWTDDVVLFRHGDVPIDADEREGLAVRGIRVVDGPVAAVDDEGVRLADGTFVERQAIAVQTVLAPNAELLAGLGVRPEPKEVNGVLFGHYVPTTPTGATSVPGLYAAGNVADPMAQVVVSAAQGMTAAAQINADLVAEEVEAARRTGAPTIR